MVSVRQIKTALVCKPTYYNGQQSTALDEHRELVATMEAQGARVQCIPPVKGLEQQVYTRDLGFAIAGGVVLGQPRSKHRRGEVLAYENLSPAPLPVRAELLAGDTFLMGRDVVCVDNDTVAVGVGIGTSGGGAAWLSQVLAPLGINVLRVPTAAAGGPLDLVFNVIAPGLALAVPELLPPAFLTFLADRQFEVIEVSVGDAFTIAACNVLVIRESTVISPAINERVNRELRKRGFEVFTVDCPGLLSGGGGPRALVLPLNRN